MRAMKAGEILALVIAAASARDMTLRRIIMKTGSDAAHHGEPLPSFKNASVRLAPLAPYHDRYRPAIATLRATPNANGSCRWQNIDSEAPAAMKNFINVYFGISSAFRRRQLVFVAINIAGMMCGRDDVCRE